MKKVLSLVMVLIIMLSLAACGGNSTNEATKQDGINLTMDNYKTYLNIEVISSFNTQDGDMIIGGPGGFLHNILYGKMTVEGASENFTYEDVHIVVKVNGTYEGWSTVNPPVPDKEYSIDLVVDTNIGGDGEDYQEISIAPFYTGYELMEYDYQIVSISGRIIPTAGK